MCFKLDIRQLDIYYPIYYPHFQAECFKVQGLDAKLTFIFPILSHWDPK